MAMNETALKSMFIDARSQNGWLQDPVGDDKIRAAYEIAKWGPTSMNTQPMRVLFLRTYEAKQRLRPALLPANAEKAMTAPVIAVIAHDLDFASNLCRTFPHRADASAAFSNNEVLKVETAFRNGTLQAAYLMLALRAVGLDVGPMSGFDAGKVDAEFFADSTWRVNFICGIGHGDTAKIYQRLPRLSFDEVSRLL